MKNNLKDEGFLKGKIFGWLNFSQEKLSLFNNKR